MNKLFALSPLAGTMLFGASASVASLIDLTANAAHSASTLWNTGTPLTASEARTSPSGAVHYEQAAAVGSGSGWNGSQANGRAAFQIGASNAPFTTVALATVGAECSYLTHGPYVEVAAIGRSEVVVSFALTEPTAFLLSYHLGGFMTAGAPGSVGPVAGRAEFRIVAIPEMTVIREVLVLSSGIDLSENNVPLSLSAGSYKSELVCDAAISNPDGSSSAPSQRASWQGTYALTLVPSPGAATMVMWPILVMQRRRRGHLAPSQH